MTAKEKKKKYDRDRYLSNPDKAEARSRKWGKENPEAKRAGNKQWYQNNKEHLKEKARVYYDSNTRACKRRMKQYRKDHPEADVAKHAKRKALKLKSGGSFTAKEWVALCKKYDHRCLRCHRRSKLTADHIVPVSKGGTSNIDNIQPLCKSCNSTKHDKTIDYRREPCKEKMLS